MRLLTHLLILGMAMSASAFSVASYNLLPLSKARDVSVCRLSMQWTPEERQERARVQAERNARLIREREERQRKLTARDQDVLQQRLTSPQDMEAKSNQYVMDEGNYGDKATGLFGWANNNPSSKSAIYDTEFINSAAGGGNVGEMMIELRGKGKTEEGAQVKIKGKGDRDLTIYYRSMGQPREGQAPVLMVHGILDHSWSWREMMKLMAKDGIQSFALDMPGCGYSSWPQPGFDYEWSEESVKETLDRFIDAVGIQQPMNLMVQGFVFGQYALQWGLENPGKVQRIIVLNTPLQTGSKLPFELQQYKLPFVSSFVAQDAMRAERFLEAGCAYAMDISDTDRYREPFLESMMPGLGVEDLMKRFDLDRTLAKIKSLATSSQIPILVAWGTGDKYLAAEAAESWCKDTGKQYAAVQGQAGYLPHVDYATSTYGTVKLWVQ